jgi:hypothetical protein
MMKRSADVCQTEEDRKNDIRYSEEERSKGTNAISTNNQDG